MEDRIISVGIDVGTTTTNLVFSRLTIQNIAGISSAPIVKVLDKEIIYRSGAFFTPLTSQVEIDTVSLSKTIEEIYNKSGINKNDVVTGAVIITGETARKQNADSILQNISSYAGNFVVAIAGGDLEAIIAGKGSGAFALSKEKHLVVLNIDIGGGTTNIAYFDNGVVIDTVCLDVGGRMIEISNGKVIAITKQASNIIDKYNLNIKISQNTVLEEINKFCNLLTTAIGEAIGLFEPSYLSEVLITSKLSKKHKFEQIVFSGGVADFVYDHHNKESDIFKFGDIGILLGYAIQENNNFKSLSWNKATETQQATVVGAGAYSVELSGSTIDYAIEILPLKNIPIVKLTPSEEKNMSVGILDDIKKKILLYGGETVALSFVGNSNMNFTELQTLASFIVLAFEILIKNRKPLIIVLEQDLAKALGMCLRVSLNLQGHPIVCIDGIVVENGDYIDIGLPLGKSVVLPVMIKTLVFN